VRIVSQIFMPIFLGEAVGFATTLWWFMSMNIADRLQQFQALSNVLFAFGSLFLTTALVYHEFVQNPELRIAQILIDPLDAAGENVAKDKYKLRRHRVDSNANPVTQTIMQTTPVARKGFLEAVCINEYRKLRVGVIICNVGVNATTVTEYSVRQIEPTEEVLGTYEQIEVLEHEKNIVLSFEFPEDESELQSHDYKLEITVIGSTTKKSKTLEIKVPPNHKTVAWRATDC
jgi:hypothetical protein